MIYVVNVTNREIVNHCDAWELGGEDRMIKETRADGWTVVRDEITFMGDMVIWVTK